MSEADDGILDFERSPLIQAAWPAWREATHSPVVAAVRRSATTNAELERFILSHYPVIEGYSRFVAAVAARAPTPSMRALVWSLSVLVDDMEQMELAAKERGQPALLRHTPATSRLADFLVAAAFTRPFEECLAMHFIVSGLRHRMWERCGLQGRLGSLVAQWSGPLHLVHVDELRRVAEAHPSRGQAESARAIIGSATALWQEVGAELTANAVSDHVAIATATIDAWRSR